MANDVTQKGSRYPVDIQEIAERSQQRITDAIANANVSSPTSPAYSTTAGQRDAFARSRISGTGFRVDSTFTYGLQTQLFDQIIAGNGSITYDANLRAAWVSGGTGPNASATLRQHYYNPYTPGSSQLIDITGTLNPDNIAFTTGGVEVGYGDEANGIGFMRDDQGVAVFLRSSVTGSPVTTIVREADWDYPQSGVDWTKSQIFVFDFQSLAVGTIRYYLFRSGVLTLVHSLHNDNVNTGPYWQLASLPPYWRAYKTTNDGQTPRVLAICTSVKSEGGVNLFDLAGFPFSASNTTSVSVSTTLIPVISIRVATTYNGLANRMLVLPNEIEIQSLDQPAKIVVLLNPTLTGGSWSAAHSLSGVEVNTGATAVTGGVPRHTLFVAGGNRAADSTVNFNGRAPLSLNAAGNTGDIMTIAAIRTGNTNAAIIGAVNWTEVR